MASFTSRLSLKKNDGTDSFKRQDFLDNLDKIDAAPGTHICTSTTRPTTWGANQRGRDILEMDTYRRLTWSGSSWIEPRVAVGTWMMGVNPGVYLNQNTSAIYTLTTVTLVRPMMLDLVIAFRVSSRPYLWTQAYCDLLIDDVVVTRQGTNSGNWADVQTTTPTQYGDMTLMAYGEKVLQPGNHTIKAKVRVGNTSTNNVYVAAIGGIAIAGQGALGSSGAYL